MSNKFLYEVRPVKPVVTPDGRAKRRPFSSLLSKEEVMEYMKSANIYRRFADTTEPIKVTGETLDSLHRERFNMDIKAICKVDEPKLEGINTPCSINDPVKECVHTPESLETEPVVEGCTHVIPGDFEPESVLTPTVSDVVEEDEFTAEEETEAVVETNEEEIESIDASEEESVEEDAYEDEIEEDEVVEEEPVQEEVTPKQEKPASNNNGNKNTIQMNNHGYHNKKKHNR